MMYAESVNMITALAKKINKECDLFVAIGLGLCTGFMISLTLCVAYIN